MSRRRGGGGGGTIVGTGDGSGVFLASGGSVGNSGLIQGGVVISGYPFQGSAGTAMNSGTIDSIFLGAGGSARNTGLIDPGIAILGAAGTVNNAGTLGASTGFVVGVNLGAGGSVQNTGLIEGAYGVLARATIANSGAIVGTAGSWGGVVIDGSGPSSLTNTGFVQGKNAGSVYISYFATGIGAVTNSGTIEGSGGPSVVNPQRHNGGVMPGAGGNVDNRGLIQGVSGIYVGHAPGTVSNSGTIVGKNLAGVILEVGGAVVDSGTIIGSSGIAISFGDTGGDLLALENGYKFVGSVSVAGRRQYCSAPPVR